MSSSPFQFCREENLPVRSTERRAYWFSLKIARMFLILESRNRMMNTFIIVNINPHVRDSLDDKSMLSTPKRHSFSLQQNTLETEYTWALIWDKSLLICFERYQGIQYSYTGRVDRNVNTLLIVNINPICKRKFRG